MILKPKNRTEWLELRQRQGIGGSEAGCVLGVNKYQSNVDLWELKTGRRQPADLSDNPAVQFGKAAECYIRELYKLEHPEYMVNYHEFWMYVRDDKPFMFATLDGEITTLANGRRGILEVKTTEIKNNSQWDEWTDRIPDSYYAQVLHQLATTWWDFADLIAYIRYRSGDEVRVTIRPYHVERKDVASDIEYLITEECKFWAAVQNDKRPALKLPEI